MKTILDKELGKNKTFEENSEEDKTFNALAFEVGTNARDGRPVVEWSRGEDDKWTHEFFQLPVSADFAKLVPALQVAYGEQYYAALQAQFDALAANQTIEKAIDGVSGMFSHKPNPVRVIFDSRQKRLADSYVDGRTVFVVLNPLAAFNSELLAFTIAHELVGHWFLQYLETFDIEAAPGSTLSTEIDDFRKGIARDVNLRAYAEVFAHIVSGRLFQKWTAASKAELFRGLENAPQIEFLDSALGYLHTTFGEQRDTKEIVELTARFVQANYFQDELHPEKEGIDSTLTRMQEESTEWAGSVEQGERLLEWIVASVVSARGSPLEDARFSNVDNERSPAAYLVKHYVGSAESSTEQSEPNGLSEQEGAQNLLQDLLERTVSAAIQQRISFANVFGTAGPVNTSEPLAKLRELNKTGGLDRAIAAGVISQARIDVLFGQAIGKETQQNSTTGQQGLIELLPFLKETVGDVSEEEWNQYNSDRQKWLTNLQQSDTLQELAAYEYTYEIIELEDGQRTLTRSLTPVLDIDPAFFSLEGELQQDMDTQEGTIVLQGQPWSQEALDSNGFVSLPAWRRSVMRVDVRLHAAAPIDVMLPYLAVEQDLEWLFRNVPKYYQDLEFHSVDKGLRELGMHGELIKKLTKGLSVGPEADLIRLLIEEIAQLNNLLDSNNTDAAVNPATPENLSELEDRLVVEMARFAQISTSFSETSFSDRRVIQDMAAENFQLVSQVAYRMRRYEQLRIQTGEAVFESNVDKYSGIIVQAEQVFSELQADLARLRKDGASLPTITSVVAKIEVSSDMLRIAKLGKDVATELSRAKERSEVLNESERRLQIHLATFGQWIEEVVQEIANSAKDSWEVKRGFFYQSPEKRAETLKEMEADLIDIRDVLRNAQASVVKISYDTYQLWGPEFPSTSILVADSFAEYPSIRSDGALRGMLDALNAGPIAATLMRQQLEWRSFTGKDDVGQIAILGSNTLGPKEVRSAGQRLNGFTDTINEAVKLRTLYNNGEDQGQPVRVIYIGDSFRLSAFEKAQFFREVEKFKRAIRQAESVGILIVTVAGSEAKDAWPAGLAQEYSNIYVVGSLDSLVSHSTRPIVKGQYALDRVNLLAAGMVLLPPYEEKQVAHSVGVRIAAARVAIAATLISYAATKIPLANQTKIYEPTHTDIIRILEATAYSSGEDAPGILNVQGALAVTQEAMKSGFDPQQESLGDVIAKIDNPKEARLLEKRRERVFDTVLARRPETRVMTVAEFAELPKDIVEFALVSQGKVIGVYDGAEFRQGVADGRILLTQKNDVGEIIFQADEGTDSGTLESFFASFLDANTTSDDSDERTSHSTLKFFGSRRLARPEVNFIFQEIRAATPLSGDLFTFSASDQILAANEWEGQAKQKIIESHKVLRNIMSTEEWREFEPKLSKLLFHVVEMGQGVYGFRRSDSTKQGSNVLRDVYTIQGEPANGILPAYLTKAFFDALTPHALAQLQVHEVAHRISADHVEMNALHVEMNALERRFNSKDTQSVEFSDLTATVFQLHTEQLDTEDSLPFFLQLHELRIHRHFNDPFYLYARPIFDRFEVEAANPLLGKRQYGQLGLGQTSEPDRSGFSIGRSAETRDELEIPYLKNVAADAPNLPLLRAQMMSLIHERRRNDTVLFNLGAQRGMSDDAIFDPNNADYWSFDATVVRMILRDPVLRKHTTFYRGGDALDTSTWTQRVNSINAEQEMASYKSFHFVGDASSAALDALQKSDAALVRFLIENAIDVTEGDKANNEQGLLVDARGTMIVYADTVEQLQKRTRLLKDWLEFQRGLSELGMPAMSIADYSILMDTHRAAIAAAPLLDVDIVPSIQDKLKRYLQTNPEMVEIFLREIEQWGPVRVQVVKTSKDDTSLLFESSVVDQYIIPWRDGHGNMILSVKDTLYRAFANDVSILQQLAVQAVFSQRWPLADQSIDAVVRLFNSELSKAEPLSDWMRFRIDRALFTKNDRAGQAVEGLMSKSVDRQGIYNDYFSVKVGTFTVNKPKEKAFEHITDPETMKRMWPHSLIVDRHKDVDRIVARQQKYDYIYFHHRKFKPNEIHGYIVPVNIRKSPSSLRISLKSIEGNKTEIRVEQRTVVPGLFPFDPAEVEGDRDDSSSSPGDDSASTDIEKLQVGGTTLTAELTSSSAVSGGRDSLLLLARESGQNVVEVELYVGPDAPSYLVGSPRQIDAYLQTHGIAKSTSNFTIRMATSFSLQRKLTNIGQVQGIWPAGQPFVTVVDPNRPDFVVDASGQIDPIQAGLVHEGLLGREEASSILWQQAELLGGPVVLLLVSENHGEASRQGPFLSIIRLGELSLIDKDKYSVVPVAATASRSPDASSNPENSLRVPRALTQNELFDPDSQGVDVFYTATEASRFGASGGWGVPRDIPDPSPPSEAGTFARMPTVEEFIPLAKERVKKGGHKGIFLLAANDTYTWMPTSRTSDANGHQYRRVYLYSDSVPHPERTVKNFLGRTTVVPPMVRVVKENGRALYYGQEGMSFENGLRVKELKDGFEKDPAVLLATARKYGFNIIQATRKKDRQAVWIAGQLNSWLREHLSQVDYEIDRMTYNPSHFHELRSYFAEVMPGELFPVIGQTAPSSPVMVRPMWGAGKSTVGDLETVLEVTYNQYGVRTPAMPWLPGQSGDTNEVLSKHWDQAKQPGDVDAVVYVNSLGIEVETDVTKIDPGETSIIPLPRSNVQHKDTFVATLVELVEAGIATLPQVRLREMAIQKNPHTGLVEQLIVGLEKGGVHGVLGVHWSLPSDSTAFDTVEKAQVNLRIPGDRILYVGRDRLEAPALLALLEIRDRGQAFEYLLDGDVYIVVETGKPLPGFTPRNAFVVEGKVVPSVMIGGAIREQGAFVPAQGAGISSFLSGVTAKVANGNPPFFLATLSESRTGQFIDGRLITQINGGLEPNLEELTVDQTLHTSLPTLQQIASFVRASSSTVFLLYVGDRASYHFAYVTKEQHERFRKQASGAGLEVRTILQGNYNRNLSANISVPWKQWNGELSGMTVVVGDDGFRTRARSLPGSPASTALEDWYIKRLWSLNGDDSGYAGLVVRDGRGDGDEFVDTIDVPTAVGLQSDVAWQKWLEDSSLSQDFENAGWKVQSWKVHTDRGILISADVALTKTGDTSQTKLVTLFWNTMTSDEEVFPALASVGTAQQHDVDKWQERDHNRPGTIRLDKGELDYQDNDLGLHSKYPQFVFRLPPGPSRPQSSVVDEYKADLEQWIESVLVEEWAKSSEGANVAIQAFVRKWPDGRVALAAVEITRLAQGTGVEMAPVVITWEEDWQGLSQRTSLADLIREDGSVVEVVPWTPRITSGGSDATGTNNFFIEVDSDNRSRVQRTAGTVALGKDGNWHRLPIADLQGAYEDPALVRQQLEELFASGAVEVTVDAINMVLGARGLRDVVRFRSGFRVLGSSAVEEGQLVMGIDAQAAQSPGLLALLLYHEKVGHGLMQYWTTKVLPKRTATGLQELRDQLKQQGALEVFAEVFAHMMSADLYVHGLTEKTKDAIREVLDSPQNTIDFGGKARAYFRAINHGEHSRAQLLTETAKFVRQSYFHNHPDKDKLDAVLAEMQNQPAAWLGRIEEAEKLLRSVVQAGVKARDGPIGDLVDKAIADNNIAAQAILRQLLTLAGDSSSPSALDKLEAAKPKPDPSQLVTSPISVGREGLLQRVSEAGVSFVELELYKRDGPPSYLVGTLRDVQKYLRFHRTKRTTSHYRISLIAAPVDARNMSRYNSLFDMWPRGQRFVFVASPLVADFAIDVTGHVDPIVAGRIEEGVETQEQLGDLLWQHAERIGAQAIVVSVSEKNSPAPFLSVMRLSDVRLIDTGQYSVVPIAIAVTGSRTVPHRARLLQNIETLTKAGIFDPETQGLDAFLDATEIVRVGVEGQWKPLEQTPMFLAEFDVMPPVEEFVRQAKQLSDTHSATTWFLARSGRQFWWIPSSILSQLKGRSFDNAYAYTASTHRIMGVDTARFFKWVALSVPSIVGVVGSGQPHVFGRDGRGFEDGSRVKVLDKGLETDPTVLIAAAEKYGFQIVQAVRKSDSQAVWIFGTRSPWLEQHLAEVEYKIDRVTTVRGNYVAMDKFFARVAPGQVFEFVFPDDSIPGRTYGTQIAHAVPDTVQSEVLFALEYNQYGVRRVPVPGLPEQPVAPTGVALDRFWSQPHRDGDIQATVYANALGIDIEVDVSLDKARSSRRSSHAA